MVVRAVFLDRDGVINRNMQRDGRAVAPTSLAEFQILPGVEAAARKLSAAGFRLVVVTNQPDISTGRTPASIVDAMHEELSRRIPLDDIRICPHVSADNCVCRKPKPGMLLAAADEFEIDLASSFMIGDRAVDIAAGRSAGCRTILVDWGNEESDTEQQPDMIVRSLTEAVEKILRQKPAGG